MKKISEDTKIYAEVVNHLERCRLMNGFIPELRPNDPNLEARKKLRKEIANSVMFAKGGDHANPNERCLYYLWQAAIEITKGLESVIYENGDTPHLFVPALRVDEFFKDLHDPKGKYASTIKRSLYLNNYVKDEQTLTRVLVHLCNLGLFWVMPWVRGSGEDFLFLPINFDVADRPLLQRYHEINGIPVTKMHLPMPENVRKRGKFSKRIRETI